MGFGVERTNLTIPVNLMVKVDNENRLIYEVFCPYFTFISSITLTIATSEYFSRYLISFFVRNSISSRQTLLFTNLIGFFFFFKEFYLIETNIHKLTGVEFEEWKGIYGFI